MNFEEEVIKLYCHELEKEVCCLIAEDDMGFTNDYHYLGVSGNYEIYAEYDEDRDTIDDAWFIALRKRRNT